MEYHDSLIISKLEFPEELRNYLVWHYTCRPAERPLTLSLRQAPFLIVLPFWLQFPQNCLQSHLCSIEILECNPFGRKTSKTVCNITFLVQRFQNPTVLVASPPKLSAILPLQYVVFTFLSFWWKPPKLSAILPQQYVIFTYLSFWWENPPNCLQY